MKITRNKKALVKDLELQIDYLVGYSPNGAHWKQEYHIRKILIEETLASENTPPEVRDKIFRIQESLYKLQQGTVNNQGYLQYSVDEYKPTHKVRVTDYQAGICYYIEI